jgi:hypothetical protein
MFGGKKVEKLQGPKEIPVLVQNYLMKEKKMDPDLVRVFKAVVRRQDNEGNAKAFDIRIFDEGNAVANKIQIKDYTTLDQYPNMIMYDGLFDEKSKEVKLEEKNKFMQETTLFTQDEIQQKIEALSEPGSSVFIYMARGPSNGGPLGRGCAIVELAPQVAGKKQKKYCIYCSDVVDMKPVNKGDKLFDSDKAKEVAKWIKDAHHKRMY